VGKKTAEELLRWARAKARRITVDEHIDGNTAMFESMGLDLDDVETMASSVGLEAEDLLLIPTHVSVGSTDSAKDTDNAAEHSNEVGEDRKLIAEIRSMLDQHAQTSTRRALGREDAAEYLGIEPKQLDYLMRCRKIRFVKLGDQRGRVFRVEDLDMFLEDNLQLTGDEILRRRTR